MIETARVYSAGRRIALLCGASGNYIVPRSPLKLAAIYNNRCKTLVLLLLLLLLLKRMRCHKKTSRVGSIELIELQSRHDTK